MSIPPQERALAFPLLWEKPRAHTEREQQEATLPTVSDEEILSRLQANDPAALNLLFGRYARVALGIARRILRDSGEAEDAVQEAFLYIFQKSALFDPSKGTARSWIIHIVYHRALDRREYLARRSFYIGTDVGPLDDALLGETDLDREIGSKLDREQLKKAFEGLEERQRRTLELFYFEGMELREISKVLQEPFGNVRHYYYRGLEKLRKNAFVKKLRKK